MNVNFVYNEADANEKVYFEQIYAERPGGVLVANPIADAVPSTPVAHDGEAYQVLNAGVIYEAATISSSSTSVKVVSGSIPATGSYNFYTTSGAVAVKVTSITAGDDYDTIKCTCASGHDAVKGEKLYYIADDSKTYTFVGVLGDHVFGGKGDQLVKLVNGANVRKETAIVNDYIAKAIGTIHLV